MNSKQKFFFSGRTWLVTGLAMFWAVVVSFPAIGHADEQPVSFVHDVIPVLTKAGCNGGACHAKAGGGQKGFQLSLLGFETQDDYESIVLEGRGRRIFPAAAARSLILTKACGQIPHSGGVRLPEDSQGYEIVRRWIEQGAVYESPADSELVRVEVQPEKQVLQRGSQLQLKAIAHYANGRVRDVTELALYESNSEAMAHVTELGLVGIQNVPGRVSIMVRFHGKVAVFTGAVPLGAPVENLPEPKNFIDELVFSNLKEIGIPPSALIDDATFLRRVTLDIAGRIPTEVEARAFLENDAPDKREQAIDALLRSPQYADYFANKWTALLKNRRDDASDITSNFAFHAWVRDSLLANVPYDQLVRELLAATGTVVENPPVAWYKRVKDPKEQLEDVAQLFLGVRMQCAQCHHHPFERWSQNDYYSMAAFFTQIGRKPTGVRNEDLIYHKRGMAQAQNVKTGMMLAPTALGDSLGDIAPDEDPRLRLANWMGNPENPFFAKALVNRYWKHFFARGLVEPEDDIRDTNPPSNPELLEALEKHFVASGYDLKELIRTITRSQAYQLSAIPNEHNLTDMQNYSRFYPRRLQAEVMLDAIDYLSGSPTRFANLPAGTRAIALPDNSYNRASQFLMVFGRPDNQSVCECERVQSSSLSQSLHLINSAEMKNKLAAANGRADKFMKDERSVEEKVTELYFSAFSRPPSAEELAIALEYIQSPVQNSAGMPLDANAALRQNWQDLVWALVNTKEFLFNH